jgi:transposase-like protein
VTLDIAAAFEQLALWSKKEKMCASCYTERGTVEIGPTPYCHVQYFMCAPCAEHFQVAA